MINSGVQSFPHTEHASIFHVWNFFCHSSRWISRKRDGLYLQISCSHLVDDVYILFFSPIINIYRDGLTCARIFLLHPLLLEHALCPVFANSREFLFALSRCRRVPCHKFTLRDISLLRTERRERYRIVKEWKKINAYNNRHGRWLSVVQSYRSSVEKLRSGWWIIKSFLPPFLSLSLSRSCCEFETNIYTRLTSLYIASRSIAIIWEKPADFDYEVFSSTPYLCLRSSRFFKFNSLVDRIRSVQRESRDNHQITKWRVLHARADSSKLQAFIHWYDFSRT